MTVQTQIQDADTRFQASVAEVLRVTRAAWLTALPACGRMDAARPMLDCSDFPLVYLRPEAFTRGWAFRWGVEMERLLARHASFVMVYPPALAAETHDDRRLRTCWMRGNQQALSRYCRGAIVLEPVVTRRAATRVTARASHACGGVRVLVIADPRNIGPLSHVLLRGVAPTAREAAARVGD